MKSLAVAALSGCLALAPHLWGEQHLAFLNDDPAILTHAVPGYLGVGTRDVDAESAAQLKLKEARGAEIITVDHDAPAGKIGLRVHDVILQLNDQPIMGEAQLGRLLRETPPGRTVTLLISRAGQQMTLTVQLADRSTLEADAWSQHIPVVPDDDDGAYSLPGSNAHFGSGFLSSLGINSSYTGLDLDMLGPQLADYFGVTDGQGLLVKRVDEDSPAAAAGLRAGDVITRVNGKLVATTSQWVHAMHANRGKSVQLTVIRDRKESTVTMTAGRPKQKGFLGLPIFPAAIVPSDWARGMAHQMEHFQSVAAAQMTGLWHDIGSL